VSDTVISGRLHPMTPVRRSWVQLSAFGWMAYGQRDRIDFTPDSLGEWVFELGGTVALLAAIIAGFTASWAKTSFTLSTTHLSYGFGLWHQTRRTFPIEQIRTVDVSRPLWARVFRVAELTVSTESTNQKISCLSIRDAEQLRATVLQLAKGEVPGTEESGEGVIARVDSKQLALSILLDIRVMGKVVFGAAFAVAPYLYTDHVVSLALLLPWLRSAWRATGKRFPADHGWTVREVEDGYRTEYGLFNKGQYTWQRDRITSVTFHQPILWRSRDWVSVSGGLVGFSSYKLLPVATRAQAEKLLVGLMGVDALKVMDVHYPVGRKAKWCTPFWRACGYSESDGFFAAWQGLFLKQRVTVARTDAGLSVTAEQGMWQRLHGRASVTLELSGGQDVTAVHREVGEAEELTEKLRLTVRKHTLEGKPIRRIRLESKTRSMTHEAGDSD